MYKYYCLFKILIFENVDWRLIFDFFVNNKIYKFIN